MIYLPPIYPDELFYSWATRMQVHNGFPTYITIKEELMESKTNDVKVEFFGRLNDETTNKLEKKYGMMNLLMHHTMFPQYAVFLSKEKQKECAKKIIQGMNLRETITMPERAEPKELSYCPVCAREDRKLYGETYWHRSHFIRGVNICAKHGCRLVRTGIIYSNKAFPKLYCANSIAEETEPIYEQNEVEAELAKYVVNIFEHMQMKTDNVEISPYLISKLNGTEYIKPSGRIIQMTNLFEDLQGFYKDVEQNEIKELNHAKKILYGLNHQLYEIAQLAFFLEIECEELLNPKLPEVSQKEQFEQQVLQLKKEGKGINEIKEMMGSSHTVEKIIKQLK